MPLIGRTMGNVLDEQKNIAASRKRKDAKLAEEQSLKRDRLALDTKTLDVDAGIRNRLAGIQERQAGFEGRRVGQLEKTGEVERGLATRQEDRLSGEQSFTQGLRERKLALDVGKTFKGGEAANQIISGDMTFFDSTNLEPRPTGQPQQGNLQYIKPTFDEEGKPLTQGGVFDPTSGRFGSPKSFAPKAPPANPIDAARQRFQDAMTPPSMRPATPTVPSVSGKPEDLINKLPKVTPTGKKKSVQTGKGKAGDAHIKAKESQAERRDKSILARLAKKKKSGKMSATELDQFNKLHTKYIR